MQNKALLPFLVAVIAQAVAFAAQKTTKGQLKIAAKEAVNGRRTVEHVVIKQIIDGKEQPVEPAVAQFLFDHAKKINATWDGINLFIKRNQNATIEGVKVKAETEVKPEPEPEGTTAHTKPKRKKTETTEND